MVRDSLYRAIEEGLGGRLNPEMFERCAVDLLREVYPGLVPIRGGDDGGMDGAIADSRGAAPIPLVVTTAGSVIGNLTGNLESYRGGGGSASEAVLATSRPLTGRQRRNLEKRAGEFGIALRQIHDRADFVGRLYRNPAWRRELLGLTGDPPALSAFPRSPRAWLATELLGRDEEMAWLRTAEGDVVISGQPGVGKTALLSTLAREGHGLFAVSSEIGKIADAYRELRPDRVFVDDAHLDEAHPRHSMLNKLVRVRQELGIAFRIVATTWPGHEDDIRQVLYLTDDQTLRVKPLERKTILDLVRGVSPRFADILIGEILDQSDGRPGLAVTLAQWAHRGELKDLVNGRLLLRQIRVGLPQADSTLEALAPFALGGGLGMRLPSTAVALGISETDLRRALRPVSGTGVLQEFEEPGPHVGSLTVKPGALRVALVERSYFSGGLSLNVEEALALAEDPAACTHTLITVLARGGAVPHPLIRTRLEKLHGSSFMGGLWSDYVRTGELAARWVLENHPGMTVSVGSAALSVVPELALDLLLRAPADGGLGGRDPWQIIGNWTQAGLPGRDALQRRRLLVERAVAHIGHADGEQRDRWTSSRRTPANLFRDAFALSVHGVQTSPLDSEELRITSGSMLAQEVRALAREWPTVLESLRSLGDNGILCARDILNEWTGRLRVAGQHPETNPTAEQEAPRMLEGVVELAEQAPGIVMWARRLARHPGFHARLPDIGDSLLPKLFPATRYPHEEYPPHEVIVAAATEIADEWSQEDPDVVVERMLYCERQRHLAGHRYPDVLTYVPDKIAQGVDEPELWLRALLDQEAPPAWILPFLEAAVVVSPATQTAWEMVARNDRYDQVSIKVGLKVSGLPPEAVGCIMDAVRRRSDSVPWHDLPREWQRRLLQDTDARVRAAAAAGLWRAYRRERPDGSWGRLLQDAVIESGNAEMLKELFSVDREVARTWIFQQARVFSSEPVGAEDRHPWQDRELPLSERVVFLGDVLPGRYLDLLDSAVAALTGEDRRDLIGAIPPQTDERFFARLVGGDPSLYRLLLNRHLPKEAHLAPLDGVPSPERNELVRLARAHGYSDCGVEAPESI